MIVLDEQLCRDILTSEGKKRPNGKSDFVESRDHDAL